ncbi:MAG: hypothetical protein OEQ53_19645, partial [Saprospiraceae bacterium]|nr:hypothetical protein [Saprospiraceae bacterium]
MRLRSVRLSNLVFLAVLIVSAKCAKDQTAEEVIRESDHFIILTTTQLSTIEENEKVQSHAEEIYKRLVEILGEDRSPQKKITIRLEGPFIQQGPYFDPDGIHLFRYTQEEGGYLALLTHEIGHAFREAFYVANEVWNWSTYPYFDEGFSEYLAQLMEPGKTGFPFYGYPE